MSTEMYLVPFQHKQCYISHIITLAVPLLQHIITAITKRRVETYILNQ